MERLHAGWLVKSPPEKRTIGPWRLFKSKWRERYFVLYAPPSSQTIPGCCSTVLCYYDNENLVKEYGRIDLSHCEEILTQLESDEHRNIFALRTVNKDSERTYYLAAGSEEEMNQWAHCLCCVLRLSGGDGNNLPSGFEHLSSPYGENLVSPGRCPILTQRTGEQRRIVNVPETISKSASALNIRLADATPPSHQQQQHPASNSSTAPVPKSGRMGKRPSILNMVVKPASSSTLRRPSAPALSSVAQKFQTVGKTTGLQLMTAANTQSFLNNNSASSGQHALSSSSTLGRPVPRLTLLPPTPAVSYSTGPFTGRDFFAAEHDAGRWRFGDAAAAAVATPSSIGGGQQCPPPLLPSRPGAQSKEDAAAATQVHRHRRSSSDDWRWGKETGSRNDDLIDEDSDEGSFDPDYVLPHPVYNNDDATNGRSNEDQDQEEEEEEAEALEEDREDHYSYPPFHYNLSSQPEEGEPPRRTSPSLLTGEDDEGAPCDDNYDYLPCYSNTQAPSDRMSVTRSSTHTNNSDRRSSDNHEAIYDVLPIRNYSSEEAAAAGSVQRMSGIEFSTHAADQGIGYQNDAFRRYSYGGDGAFESPVHSRAADEDTTFLPPLPEKRKGGREETRIAGQKGTVPPLLPASSRCPDGASRYINNVDVMATEKDGNSQSISSDHDDVYLPMNGGEHGGPGDSVYTPMCSPPEAQQSLSSGETSVAGRTGRDGQHGIGATSSSSPLLGSQHSGNATDDQNPQSGSLVPIRFTANTRSFKRKVPKRESLDKRADSSTNSSEQNENLEPFPAASSPPPLPPKKSAAARNPNYIHYASLNLDDVVEKLPSPPPPLSSPSRGPGGGSQTDTLYRQIDPEKTKALCELKKQMDDNRQRNFAKLAPEH